MTQATSTDRPRREWGRVVDQINQTSDRAVFNSAMLELQRHIVAGRYGVLWGLDENGQLKRVHAWPDELAQLDPNAAVMKMLTQAAGTAIQRKSSVVLKIDIDQQPGEATDTGSHVFVTTMRREGRIEALSTVVADCRDDQVASATGPMRELAAGLYSGFVTRSDIQEYQNQAQRVHRAMALLAVCQEGRGFEGACLNLVNELTSEYACSRVSLGWIHGRHVKVVAISGTEHLKRQSEHVGTLETVMAECLDQQQPIICPVPSDAEPLLAHAVVAAHRKLTDPSSKHHTLSIPLRQGEQWVGVITLERSESTGFNSEEITQLQLIGDVLGPALADRKDGDRWLIVHAWHSVRDAASYLTGPKHVAWKLAAILVLCLLAYAVFGSWTYRVTAPFVLEAQSKRVVPAVYEGRLAEVLVEPGMAVLGGEVLAKLDDTELQLQLIEANSELQLTQLERSQAMAEADQAAAAQAQARSKQIEARIKLLRHQVSQTTIKAPEDGIVLSGYWHDKVGGVVDQGQTMFEVAPLDDLVALVRVGESDINQIDPSQPPVGRLATRSQPAEKFDIEAIRIVPLATPVDGSNVFEMRCRIDEAAYWLRPGMEGLAKIDIGERRIMWILTHRVIDTVRLWLWW